MRSNLAPKFKRETLAGHLFGPGGTIVGVVQSKLDALKLSETTDDLTQNVNFATKSAVLLKFIEDVPNLPTTRPLQPEQPLKAIRIYQDYACNSANNCHHRLILFSLSVSARSRSSFSTPLKNFHHLIESSYLSLLIHRSFRKSKSHHRLLLKFSWCPI